MLINNYQTVKQLETLLELAKKNGKGISTTTSINEKVDNYGNNVSSWVSQTKDERESKASRTYCGNGKVVFSKASEYPVAPKNNDNPF
jgi:hypothetical protein